MGRYILNRLLVSVPVLFGIIVIVFIFINLAPGDPITAVIPPDRLAEADPAWIEAQREKLGLNQPAPVRFLVWLTGVLRGDLGYSLSSGTPVAALIIRRIGPTLELTFTALVISLVIGIGVGVISALKQYSVVDYVATLMSFVSISIPGFFLALIFIYVFALRLDILPTSGMYTLGREVTVGDRLAHLLMPAIVLGTEGAASLVRFTRSSMLEVIRQDYVTTARGKGLPELTVLLQHAFRNALLPLVTIVGIRLPYLFSGAVVVEQVFGWQGMGMTGVKAAFDSDYPVLMGLGLISAILILIANLITDVAYAYVDPRIRLG